MSRRSRNVSCAVFLAATLAVLGLLGSPQRSLAQGDKKPTAVKTFTRLKLDDQGQPVAFQTALGRYASAKGDVKIDLVGVVHIAEPQYYEKFNELFKGYDVVLYEAAGGPIKGKPGILDSLDPLAVLYGSLAGSMKVHEQMKVIDYSAGNFVHADIRGEDIPEVLNRRGDNLLSLFLTIMADIIRENNLAQAKMKAEGKKAAKFDLLALFRAPESGYKLRLGMAKELARAEITLGLGKTVDSLLLDERNQACLKVLKQQLDAGKNKKIAIFYGAAHMPDLERRLMKDFAMQPQGVEWFTAWELVNPQMKKKEAK